MCLVVPNRTMTRVHSVWNRVWERRRAGNPWSNVGRVVLADCFEFWFTELDKDGVWPAYDMSDVAIGLPEDFTWGLPIFIISAIDIWPGTPHQLCWIPDDDGAPTDPLGIISLFADKLQLKSKNISYLYYRKTIRSNCCYLGIVCFCIAFVAGTAGPSIDDLEAI